MTYGKLVGTNTIGTEPCSAVHRLGRFVCDTSGVVDELRLYSVQNGLNKINIYADDDGEPGALIWTNDSGQSATADQWNAYTVPDIAFVAGNYYWIGGNGNTSGALSYSANASDTRLKPAVWGNFNAPDPAGTGFDVELDQLFGASLYGLPNPAVTDIDGDDEFFDHDTGIIMTGTDFGAAQGTGTLELADSSDYDTATLVVSQAVNSWADTSIDFDVKSGALPAGMVYAFVTTDVGQRNLVGYLSTLVIEIAAGGTISGGPVPNGYWPYNGVHENRGVSNGVIASGIRTSGGAPSSFTALNVVPGVDNIDAAIDFPAASAVVPVFRYKGGDADGTDLAGWGYGPTLALQAGTAPTYNNGSPLWKSTNDDSVKFKNFGGYYRSGSVFTGLTTQDFYFEALIRRTKPFVGFQYIINNYDETIGWLLFQAPNGSITFFLKTASKTVSILCAASGSSADVFFISAYGDRDESSIYSSAGASNGVLQIGNNISAVGDLQSTYLGVGARASDGASTTGTEVFYSSMYVGSSELWVGGVTARVSFESIHKERFAKLNGTWPSLATTYAPTSTRGYPAYTQSPSDIASADDRTKRLWCMGDNWPRVASRADSSGDASVGYLSEPEVENLNDEWQVDTWTLIDGTDTETADDLLAPDRTQTMTTLVPSTTSGEHGWSKAITIAAVTNCVSAYGYGVDSKWLRIQNDTVADCYAIFDLTAGTVYESGAGCTGVISSENYECDGDNKAYRCHIVFTGTAAAHTIKIKPQGGTTTPSDTFAGDGASKYIGVWGVQVEAGEKPTSVIVAEGSTETRAGDVLDYAANENIGGADVKAGRIAYTVHPKEYDNESTKNYVELLDSANPTTDLVGTIVSASDVANGVSASSEGNAGLSVSGVDITDDERHRVQQDWIDDNLRIAVDNIAGSTDTDCTMPDGLDVIRVGANGSGAGQPGDLISNIAIVPNGTPRSITLSTTETGSTTVTFRGDDDSELYVNWGDGNTDTITLIDVSTDVDAVHDYGTLVGTKTITISGKISGVTRFEASANTDYVGSIKGLDYLNNANYIDINTTSFDAGLKGVLEAASNVATLLAHSSDLPWEATTLSANLIGVTMYDCAWSSAEVDQCIIDVDTAGASSGTLSIAGNNAVRTTASDAALSSLVGKSWTVTVNE